MTNKPVLTSIITGDIVRSRAATNEHWLAPLKKTLSLYGKTPHMWDIFRGDSFQLEVKDPSRSLLAAFHIKATIKSLKTVDVRMAIGIGAVSNRSPKIVESEGEAFIYSGEKFETLKKEKVTLSVRSPWREFDHEMNICFRLLSLSLDGWSPASAELVKLLLEEGGMSQEEIARKLNVTQPSVSERRTRAHFDEVMGFEGLYREKVQRLLETA